MSTAFGQSVAVQRGEGDRLTDAANTIFRKAEEGSAISPDFLTFILCMSILLGSWCSGKGVFHSWCNIIQ